MPGLIDDTAEIRYYIKELLISRGENVTEKLITRVYHFYKAGPLSACGGDFKTLAITYGLDYHVYCSLIVCIFGIITNSLNIIVLTRKDMATAPINRILTALACADILLMLEYIPFVIYRWVDTQIKSLPYMGAVYMFLHMHATLILHTTSICLTLMLAVWRFLAIRFVDKNHIFCSMKRCTIGIITCYVLPVVLCLPQYVVLKVTAMDIVENGKNATLYHVTLSDFVNKHESLLNFGFWTNAIIIKLLPCVILVAISLWLIRTLIKAKRGRQVLKSYDTSMLDEKIHLSSTKFERRADRTTKMLIAILVLFLLAEVPQGIYGVVIAINGKRPFLTCYQHYGDLMDFLAILNGSINFILYCCMNRMFRITFGQLFRKQILNRWVQPTVSDTPTVILGNNKLITTTAV